MKSVAVFFLLGALATSAAPASAQDEWLVFEVAPLTGPASTVGTRLSRPIRMWADEVNDRGGIKGKKIKLVSCNDEGRPEKAVACTRDAVRQGAAAVIANTLTASLRAMQPVLENGPVMIVASPNLAPGADTPAFQTSPSDEGLTEALANFLKKNKIDKMGMIAATDASGEVAVSNARKVFEAHKIGLDIARVDLKATDATSQIAAVAGVGTRIVFSSYSGVGAATVVKSFKNLGLQQPLVISYANLSQAFIDVVRDVMPPRLMGTGLKALVPSTQEDPVLRQRAENFMVAYRQKYNEVADLNNILGKFSADVVEALLNNVRNPSNLKEAKAFLELATIESLHRIHFSSKSHVGLGADDVLIVEYKNGEWIAAESIR